MKHEDKIAAILAPAIDTKAPYAKVMIAHLAAELEHVRQATIEECARIVETAPDMLQNSTFDGAAEAIRALRLPPSEPGN